MQVKLDNASVKVSRDKLQELLVFAREKIHDSLDLEGCWHTGWFTIEDENCQICNASSECAWLLHNDGVLPFSERSDEDLYSALRFALELLSVTIRENEHEVQSCACETCTWLRSTRRSLAHRA